MINRLWTEFIGTFFLVLIIGLCVGAVDDSVAPLAIGVGLMALVYMGGHVSGAHYNPAVTVGLLIRGTIKPFPAFGYILSQLAAGLCAAVIAAHLRGAEHAVIVRPGSSATVFDVVLSEALFTFALMSVILHVATSRDHPDNHFYGWAIGAIVAAGAYAVGGISGAAFNPAVAVGLNCVARRYHELHLYCLASVGGAVLASISFRLANTTEFETKTDTVESTAH